MLRSPQPATERYARTTSTWYAPSTNPSVEFECQAPCNGSSCLGFPPGVGWHSASDGSYKKSTPPMFIRVAPARGVLHKAFAADAQTPTVSATSLHTLASRALPATRTPPYWPPCGLQWRRGWPRRLTTAPSRRARTTTRALGPGTRRG